MCIWDCFAVCVLSSFWRCICHLSAKFASNYTLQRHNDNCCPPLRLVHQPRSPLCYPPSIASPTALCVYANSASSNWQPGTNPGLVRCQLRREEPERRRSTRTSWAVKLETGRFDWPGQPPLPSRRKAGLRVLLEICLWPATAHAPSIHCEKSLDNQVEKWECKENYSSVLLCRQCRPLAYPVSK